MMSYEFQYRDKIPVVILGATGSVGQRFVQLLASHPWFHIIALAASERSVGKTYKEAVNWLMPTLLPEAIGEMRVVACEPDMKGVIAFSGLDSSVAGDVERRFAEAGFVVVSNSSNHRMASDVPLLIPEVNSSHLELLKQQKFPQGKIVTNPNCTVIGLAMALKPLQDAFGIEAVHVVTMQAVSGAGYPGVASLDILDNVIPWINGEESKVEQEPLKILGKYQDGAITNADFRISAQCNRVPLTDGHTECVSIKLREKASAKDIIHAWKTFKSEFAEDRLPMAPEHSIYYFEENNFPQPKLHRNLDKGMSVSIGRLRICPLFDYKFALLSHNTIRGAAGCAILNAELMVKQGLIYW